MFPPHAGVTAAAERMRPRVLNGFRSGRTAAPGRGRLARTSRADIAEQGHVFSTASRMACSGCVREIEEIDADVREMGAQIRPSASL